MSRLGLGLPWVPSDAGCVSCSGHQPHQEFPELSLSAEMRLRLIASPQQPTQMLYFPLCMGSHHKAVSERQEM